MFALYPYLYIAHRTIFTIICHNNNNNNNNDRIAFCIYLDYITLNRAVCFLSFLFRSVYLFNFDVFENSICDNKTANVYKTLTGSNFNHFFLSM